MLNIDRNRYERIWVLAKTDFLKRYYGSFLGLVWALINPAVQLLIYYYVFTIVFKSRVENFAIFLFLGLVLYMFFTEATGKAIKLFPSQRYILENIRIKKLDIFYASLASAFIAFLFNFGVYLFISLFFPIDISLQVVLFPLIILNLVLFVLGAMLILSVIFVYLRDIQHLWDLMKMILLWMSGIFYPIDPSATWKSAILAYLTPLPGIVSNSRAILIYGEAIDWKLFVYDYLYAFILLGIGLFVLRNYSSKAIEKL